MIHARGNVPIDSADVIAGCVFAHLVEIHALALEDGVICPRERFGHDAVRAQLKLADFLEDFAGDHAEMMKEECRMKNASPFFLLNSLFAYGTGSSSKIF